MSSDYSGGGRHYGPPLSERVRKQRSLEFYSSCASDKPYWPQYSPAPRFDWGEDGEPADRMINAWHVFVCVALAGIGAFAAVMLWVEFAPHLWK